MSALSWAGGSLLLLILVLIVLALIPPRGYSRFLPLPGSLEREYVTAALREHVSPAERHEHLKDLARFIQRDLKWKGRGLYWQSEGGCIRLCDDIYGYEVKLLYGTELLDCRPSYYNLNFAQAKELYDLICASYNRRTVEL